MFGCGLGKESPSGWKVASPVVETGKTTMLNNKSDCESRGLIGRHLLHFLGAVEDAFKMRPVHRDEQCKMFDAWVKFIGKESIEATLKWFYASLFSTIGSQILPSLWGITNQDELKKKLNFMMGGRTRIGRFMRMMLLVNRDRLKSGGSLERRRAMTIASTLANLKKGSPSPSEKVVDATMVKHRDAMINKNLASEVGPLRGSVTDKEIERTIESIVREVFSNQSCKPSTSASAGTFKDDSGFPSINAHFESSRAHAGAASFLRESCSHREGNELDSMTYHPHLGVTEIRGFKVNPIVDKFFQSQRVFNSKPAFILEPLKVRTVTAGPSLEYFIVKPIQKFLWGTIKDHPTFRFIGEPASADYLTKFFMNRKGSGSPNWLSGDYTAATDNLRKRFSQCAWNAISRYCGFDEWMRRLGSNCLVGHRIWYPDGIVVDQENGQLMGSPLSFPILCIVNAAICKLAYELGDWSSDGMELRDCPILVNGDDCVMDFNHNQKSWWERISAQVGLSPSIGKCYYAKSWLQINSTNFLMKRDGSFLECPYINFSLASKCKSKGDDERHWTGLGAAANAFVHGFDPSEQDRLLTIFIRRQRELLKTVPCGMSWWLPTCLGGLGLPVMDVSKVVVGNQKEARKLSYTLSRYSGTEGPLTKEETVKFEIQRKFYLRNLRRNQTTRVDRDRETVKVQNVTRRQLRLAGYLRALLDSGNQTFRKSVSPDVADWVNEGMKKASAYELCFPQPPSQSWEAVKPRSEWREAANDSGISSFMWEALGNSENDDRKKSDALLCTESWNNVWLKSKDALYISPEGVLEDFDLNTSLTDVLFYNPPIFCLPGGLEEVYRRSVDSRPVKLIDQISACYAFRNFGIASKLCPESAVVDCVSIGASLL